jgi:tRNA(Ile)-lysidine synthase
MALSTPLTGAEFERLMVRLGPFEPNPALAVAVSGGPDSLALALLAGAWARARGGTLLALTVDHRLRPDSGAEAARVGAWLGAHGIAQRILVREGPSMTADIQAAAREARYRLLRAACRGMGILHLLTAHHRDDQAETLLLHLARGSGADGLAGIAPIVEEGPCRLLRPLLDIPKVRLIALLRAKGQAWVEDPSNENPAFARTAMRRLLAGDTLPADRLAETARRLAPVRIAREHRIGRLLAEAVGVDPAGFARLDPRPLGREAELAADILGRVVATIGGLYYPPRRERLDRLARELLGAGIGRGRTLGGCRLLAERGRILVVREAVSMAPGITVTPGETAFWDGRFRFRLDEGPADLTLGALGTGVPRETVPFLPRRVLPTLPALRQGDRVVGIPHLDWWLGPVRPRFVRFEPLRPVAGCGFTVV